MGIVKIIISIPGKNVIMKESRMNPYFDNEEKLIRKIESQGGRLSVFLDGWCEILPYPKKRTPDPKDRLLSVILDKGDEKRSYELYESEFHILSEIWKEKKWGFSAVDLLGNTVTLEEYDYISRLQESGSVYSGSRKIYSMSHESEISEKKKFFMELTENLKRDYEWLFGLKPAVIMTIIFFLIVFSRFI